MSLIGRKRKSAYAVGAFTFSSLSAIFPRSYRSTIYIMASIEAYLATELDCARGGNLDDSNLDALIADYFAMGESKAKSDDGNVGKPLCFVDV